MVDAAARKSVCFANRRWSVICIAGSHAGV
jgi:hypothetical protein